MSILRNEDEIEEGLDRASEAACGPSKWSGMTYEQGLRDALDWVLGNEEEFPLDVD